LAPEFGLASGRALFGLPALFAMVAPSESANIPLTIGALAFGVTIISARAAFSARETFRVHMNDLGDRRAIPVDKADYDRLRAQALKTQRQRKTR
jgi:hypothetical protein